MLGIRLLGDIEVARDGERLALPPSRKTRALLAYLALAERPLRRDHLCALLWEVPDDPKGALRWSLSRLRQVVDEPGRTRIAATRETVSFEPAGAHVDLAAARSFHEALSAARAQDARLSELRAAASLARLLHRSGRSPDAGRMLEPLVARFDKGWGTPDLCDARDLIRG